MSSEKEVFGRTDYKTAVHWCHNSYILCNNIAEIDSTIYNNAHFEWEENTEIFQWYLTNASSFDVEFLESTFGLLFTYSELLDCYVLCVDHWGTSWDYVACEVLDNEWFEINGKKHEFKH